MRKLSTKYLITRMKRFGTFRILLSPYITKKSKKFGKTFRSFDGTSIYYECWKTKTKKLPFVFIHGLSGNLTGWQKIARHFYKKGHSCLLLDLRGHGYSDSSLPLKKYNIASATRDLELILKRENVSKAVIFAHCMGSLIAVEFTYRNRKIVEKLILFSPELQPQASRRVRIGGKIAFSVLSAIKPIWKKAEKYPRQINLQKTKGRLDVDLYTINDFTSMDPDIYLQYFSEILQFNAIPHFLKLKKPMLIIHGKRDIIFNYISSYNLANEISNLEFVLLPNVNHHVPINAAMDCITFIENFLSDKK